MNFWQVLMGLINDSGGAAAATGVQGIAGQAGAGNSVSEGALAQAMSSLSGAPAQQAATAGGNPWGSLMKQLNQQSSQGATTGSRPNYKTRPLTNLFADLMGTQEPPKNPWAMFVR